MKTLVFSFGVLCRVHWMIAMKVRYVSVGVARDVVRCVSVAKEGVCLSGSGCGRDVISCVSVEVAKEETW